MAKFKINPLGKLSWCFYDWANSAFPTVVITFIFSAYFTEIVANDEISGTSQWGWALSISGLAVAISAPLLGAISDHTGRKKPWILFFTVLCAILTGLLWHVKPEIAFVFLALILVGGANYAFEMAMVFYNAMLPNLATQDQIGKMSGWGWGLGYAGGLVCLGFALIVLVNSDTPIFRLNKLTYEHLRAIGPLVAIWMVLFAFPLFLWTPDDSPSDLAATKAIQKGCKKLLSTIRQAAKFRYIIQFLLARMFYVDGLNTLFAFGGIYAAGTFGMSFKELIIFGITINITAGMGAVGFAWLDDKIGSKRTIQIAISGLLFFSSALLFAEEKLFFWIFALPLGIFVGPTQAASRSMMAHLAPESMRAEMFGLFALSGKATSFLGPAILALVTNTFNSQRAGMATILLFFALGLALLAGVPQIRKKN